MSWYILHGYDNKLFPVVTDQKGIQIKDCCLLKKGALYLCPSMLLQYFREHTPYHLSSDKEMNKQLKQEGVLGNTREHRSAHSKINGVRCLKLDIKLLQKKAHTYSC